MRRQWSPSLLCVLHWHCSLFLLLSVAATIAHPTGRTRSMTPQQHLIEELQMVEHCYHDNPTLEVELEMQEKKMALKEEFNDSWIVPFDNFTKDDIPEKGTHL
ncbi:podocalyxin isoform X1 [Tachysurus fulvidraco]|uniref:podocalyxin isoform X1 n=1 Tax=Tachysurus fulvidraco TaxID=1234273 RepID=UPI000F50AD59|nr:podocalyxin isoform X1 [Tachysurus fulvidraco]